MSIKLDAPTDQQDLRQITASGAVALLHTIHETSGLTWDQMGRTIGVLGRTVQYWATGLSDPIVEHRRERIAEVYRVIASVPGDTVEEHRAALLDSSGGRSILHQLTLDAPHGQQIQFDAFTVRDRITFN